MKHVYKTVFAAMTSLLSAGTLLASETGGHVNNEVIINDKILSTEEIIQLASLFDGEVYHGNYWYDSKTGVWGTKCGPGQGIGAAGLELGGTLKKNASCGTTRVYINGRELHIRDLAALQYLSGPIAPGHYWMDANFNAGFEGGPALINFKMLAAQRNRRGDHFWGSYFGAGNSNADNSQGYVNVPGHGPVGYGY